MKHPDLMELAGTSTESDRSGRGEEIARPDSILSRRGLFTAALAAAGVGLSAQRAADWRSFETLVAVEQRRTPGYCYTQYLALLDSLGVSYGVIVQPTVYGTDNRRTAEAIAMIRLINPCPSLSGALPSPSRLSSGLSGESAPRYQGTALSQL